MCDGYCIIGLACKCFDAVFSSFCELEDYYSFCRAVVTLGRLQGSDESFVI
jgi:hypothetical protein